MIRGLLAPADGWRAGRAAVLQTRLSTPSWRGEPTANASIPFVLHAWVVARICACAEAWACLAATDTRLRSLHEHGQRRYFLATLRGLDRPCGYRQLSLLARYRRHNTLTCVLT
eukprot:6186672-Pleurochrysis_carterae.AAC.2